jgi:hypothetical protein
MGKEYVKDSKELNFKGMVILAAVIVTIIFVAAISIYINKFGWPRPLDTLGTLEQFGSFGDFIGGLMNPLLQFVVIFMLLWSIQVQRMELKATRDTLDATKDELSDTKEANKIQAAELEKQTKILLTQQQDNLDHIKVEQELGLLKRQRAILEGLFSKVVVPVNNYSIRHLFETQNPESFMVGLAFFDDSTNEGILGRRITQELQLFSTGLCGLLKCKNIPLSSALVEVHWLAGVLNKLVNIKVIKKELVSNIEGNIFNRIEESSLSKENKVFFRDNLSHKYSN